MLILRLPVFMLFLSNCISAYAGSYFNEIKPRHKTLTSSIFSPTRIDTIVIRFDYKQSALFQAYTLEKLDSIINILKKDTSIKIGIDGFAYKDEGSDTICYYLSLNRALFIHTYIVGRGVDSARITSLNAYGRTRQKYFNIDKNGGWVNCRAELRLIYPPPPKKKIIADKDEDGVEDSEDACPDIFGYSENRGCPDSGRIIVPFAVQESILVPMTFYVLDSVVRILKENPAINISISGHAGQAEGIYTVSMQLAAERAEMVKNYLLSRQINKSRILEMKNYGITRPINTAKNPQQILRNARAEIRFENQ